MFRLFVCLVLCFVTAEIMAQTPKEVADHYRQEALTAYDNTIPSNTIAVAAEVEAHAAEEYYHGLDTAHLICCEADKIESKAGFGDMRHQMADQAFDEGNESRGDGQYYIFVGDQSYGEENYSKAAFLYTIARDQWNNTAMCYGSAGICFSTAKNCYLDAASFIVQADFSDACLFGCPEEDGGGMPE